MHEIRDRLKLWRAAKKLTQADAATNLGMAFRTYQNYEGSISNPNADAFLAFVEGGINANWLLTGEGPMLLADLAPAAAVLPPAKINIDALEALLVGALKIGRNSPPHLVAALCARLYGEAHDSGFITADGIGHGNMDEAC